jgi:hypothetical protein
MLPGFRFLFAAIVLSMSVLIFGLGAAALLRSAHEEFASLPSRRAPAEQVFPRQNDLPTLALLRFDPPVLDNKSSLDNKPWENGPAAAASETVTPAEPAPNAAPAEPEKLAALKPEEPMPAAAAKPEIPAEETTAATPVTPAGAATPVATEEVKVAAIAETPEPVTVAVPPTDKPSLESNIAATKIATLGGPAVIIEEKTAASTTEEAKPDRSEARKRNAQRARERRRIAARRARLAAARHAAAMAAQQQANPFGQTVAPRATQ